MKHVGLTEGDILQIRAVLFDMDGLMFNTEDIYRMVLELMAKNRGKILTDQVHRLCLGKRAYESMSILKDAWNTNEDVDSLILERDRMFSELLDENIKPNKGLFELLHTLESLGTKTAVVTSTHLMQLSHNLEMFRLASRFQALVYAELVSKGKPDPECYQLAMSKLGFEPGSCIALENSLNGIRSAKAAGAITFAVPNRFNRDADFSLADSIFNDLLEVNRLFAAKLK